MRKELLNNLQNTLIKVEIAVEKELLSKEKGQAMIKALKDCRVMFTVKNPRKDPMKIFANAFSKMVEKDGVKVKDFKELAAWELDIFTTFLGSPEIKEAEKTEGNE